MMIREGKNILMILTRFYVDNALVILFEAYAISLVFCNFRISFYYQQSSGFVDIFQYHFCIYCEFNYLETSLLKERAIGSM